MENLSKRQYYSAAVNSAFGTKLRAARRSRDISQGELASRVGLSRVSIATLEGGRQNIQLSQVFLLAEALNVPVTELVPTLSEVEQRLSRDAMVATNPITASGARFLEDARSLLLLQLKRDTHEHEASDETANRAAGLGFAGRTRD